MLHQNWRRILALGALGAALISAGCGGAGGGGPVGTGQAAQGANEGVVAGALQGKWRGTDRSESLELDVAPPSGNVFTAKLAYKNTETGVSTSFDLGCSYDQGAKSFVVTTSRLNSANNAGQINDQGLVGARGTLIQNGQFMTFQIPNANPVVLTKG